MITLNLDQEAQGTAGLSKKKKLMYNVRILYIINISLRIITTDTGRLTALKNVLSLY